MIEEINISIIEVFHGMRLTLGFESKLSKGSWWSLSKDNPFNVDFWSSWCVSFWIPRGSAWFVCVFWRNDSYELFFLHGSHRERERKRECETKRNRFIYGVGNDCCKTQRGLIYGLIYQLTDWVMDLVVGRTLQFRRPYQRQWWSGLRA